MKGEKSAGWRQIREKSREKRIQSNVIEVKMDHSVVGLAVCACMYVLNGWHGRRGRVKCAHKPLWSWLCCLCCSSILSDLGEPCTPHLPCTAASDTTTSELQWRLQEEETELILTLMTMQVHHVLSCVSKTCVRVWILTPKFHVNKEPPENKCVFQSGTVIITRRWCFEINSWKH